MKMKNIFFVLFFIFITSNSNAQVFEFDLLTKYNCKTEYNNFESEIYSNSKGQNYFLYIKSDLDSKKMAALYDIAKMVTHNFEIIESAIKSESFFELKYLYSNKTELSKNFENFEIEYSIINEDSLSKEIKVDFYKNSKRKKINHSIVLNVKENNTNLFPLFRFSCLHPFEFNQSINLPENIIVESAKAKNVSGSEIAYKLLLVKQGKLEDKIPIISK